MDDLISRQAAIDYFMTNTNWYDEDGDRIEDWDEKRKLIEDYFYGVPSVQPDLAQLLAYECGKASAQPTLYGYNIEHLELIARVLQEEDLPPERVVEALTDIGRIVAIVQDEFEEALRRTVEQCET